MSEAASTPVPVIQADRDAAAEYAMTALRWNRDVVDAIENGSADGDRLVQAFARHRASAIEAARRA